TSSDRTLFFDFFPLEAMTIKGYKTKFQLYTVPGQVIYNTTRQLVLRGVDGIVFVAESQYDKMAENIESFQNLIDNLKTLKLNLDNIPYVLQYNKRDLPDIAPIEYMEYILNNKEVRVSAFASIATKCEGVFETLNAISKLLLHKYINEMSRK
ncbi:MAG TPA: ADP-ribosylation factor-like protein, partial [Verrucomicrobiota bacterium]|nr:ADP-ribosylation factor-like protein [Verrucomicrobiota bacterium]